MCRAIMSRIERSIRNKYWYHHKLKSSDVNLHSVKLTRERRYELSRNGLDDETLLCRDRTNGADPGVDRVETAWQKPVNG